MISALGKRLTRLSERYVPDPFILALGLTLFTAVMALVFGAEVQGYGGVERLSVLGTHWFETLYDKPWMRFALQMVIILMTGHALAISRPVQRLIRWLTKFAVTPGAAAVLVAVVACLASLIQWGLGAIAGAFMAREVGRVFAEQGRAVHYPLLGAAGYAGFLVWHGGASGTAPLDVAQSGHDLEDALGQIAVSDTLLTDLNFAVIGSLLVIIPLLFWLLMPGDPEDMEPIPDEQLNDDSGMLDVAESSANAHPLIVILESSRLLNILIGGVMLLAFGNIFVEQGIAGWDLNSLNLLFLTLGILAHPSPKSYAAAFGDAAKGAAPIVLQFPFYFGILGLLVGSGLIEQLSSFFVSISTETTYPLLTFLSAGIVNFFVPSGGGQWAVQGEMMVQALNQLDIEPHRVIMALAYGDAWTNMLQPFWALPLLGIMGLRARDIIGYTGFVFLVTGPWIMFLLLVF